MNKKCIYIFQNKNKCLFWETSDFFSVKFETFSKNKNDKMKYNHKVPLCLKHTET